MSEEVEDLVLKLLDAERTIGGLCVADSDGNIVFQTENWDLSWDLVSIFNLNESTSSFSILGLKYMIVDFNRDFILATNVKGKGHLIMCPTADKGIVVCYILPTAGPRDALFNLMKYSQKIGEIGLEQQIRKQFKVIDGIEDLTRRYVAKQLKDIESDIAKYSPSDLDNKLKQRIAKQIDKFAYLIDVKGYTAPKKELLIDYCFQQCTALRRDLRHLLEENLESQILEESSTETSSLMETIDALIQGFVEWEKTGQD